MSADNRLGMFNGISGIIGDEEVMSTAELGASAAAGRPLGANLGLGMGISAAIDPVVANPEELGL